MKLLYTTLLFLFLALPVYAQENAGVVSDVWYSPSNISAGDTVKIYSGIYNSSNVKITGVAVYYIDGAELQKISFTSLPKSLIQVEGQWKATAGDHKVKLKISTSTSALTKTESEEGTLSVQKQQKPLTIESLKKDAENIITKTVDTIDPQAEKLAGKIKEFGKDVKINPTKNAAIASVAPITNTLLQKAFDGAAFLARHWAWTLLGLIIAYFVYKRY